MIQRISQLIKSKKITASQFADEIGVQRSSVSHVLSGRNKPSLDFVTKILLAYPDINSDWLLSGKGMMLSMHNHDEQSLAGEMFSKDGNDVEDKAEVMEDVLEKPEIESSRRHIEHKKAGHKQYTPGLKSIEKIVLFYNDGTFIEFIPDQ